MTREAYLDTLSAKLYWRRGQREYGETLSEYRAAFDRGEAEGRDEESLCEAFGDPRAVAAAILRERWTPIYALPFARLLFWLAGFWGLAAYWWDWFSFQNYSGFFLLLFSVIALFFAADGPIILRCGAPENPQGEWGKRCAAGLCIVSVLSLALTFFIVANLSGISLWHFNIFELVHDGTVWRGMIQITAATLGKLALVSALCAWFVTYHINPGAKELFPFLVIVTACMGAVHSLVRWFPTDPDFFDRTVGYAFGELLFGGVAALMCSLTLSAIRKLPGRSLSKGCTKAPERFAALVSDPEKDLFLDALSRQMAFRFHSWERREITEDYSEYFEAGHEEGKTSGEICGSFGKPEVIVKILCRERRGRALAFPPVKTAAACLAVGMVLLLYSGIMGFGEKSLRWLGTAEFWLLYPILILFPLFSILAAGRDGSLPRMNQRDALKTSIPLCLAAAAGLALPILLLACAVFDWYDIPLWSGPMAICALYVGFVAAGAAVFLNLCAFPQSMRPFLFILSGYIAANAEMVQLCSSMTDTQEVISELAVIARLLLAGVLLAVVFAGAQRFIHRGGGLGGVRTTTFAATRKERIDRVKRVSALALALGGGRA